MILTTDNKELNEATKNLIKAVKATNKAVNAEDINIEELEQFEANEEAAEEVYFNIIYKMLPAKIRKQMEQPQNAPLFKAKTIDKYILPFA